MTPEEIASDLAIAEQGFLDTWDSPAKASFTRVVRIGWPKALRALKEANEQNRMPCMAIALKPLEDANAALERVRDLCDEWEACGVRARERYEGRKPSRKPVANIDDLDADDTTSVVVATIIPEVRAAIDGKND